MKIDKKSQKMSMLSQQKLCDFLWVMTLLKANFSFNNRICLFPFHITSYFLYQLKLNQEVFTKKNNLTGKKIESYL